MRRKDMEGFSKIIKHTDVMVGIGLLVIVSMLIIPLPHFILDTGLVLGIAGSIVILLMAVNVSDPLQFSSFPSVLLISTLFRLALSIAATKLILGTGEAGHVIQTFGDFVMGGDFVVGFVAFLILVIVQFVVITNGAGRVSEVVARFTLDALPGKQMAIDADLAAGLLDEEQARDRRKQVKQEADFYGAMDGASKFVKGDAIAGILIIAVNIIGGFGVGMMRGESDPLTILKTYAILSVGEGLVSQLPALFISTASGLMVTRAGQDRSMGNEVASQVLKQPRALMIAGGALALMAFVPGFPVIIFLSVGGILFAIGRFFNANPTVVNQFDNKKPEKPKAIAPPAPTGPEAVLPLLAVDAVEIEIGYGLTKLADAKQGGELPDRITATRRQIATELGFVMPSIRIRDSINLGANEYIIKMRGEEIARATCMPDMNLAVASGEVTTNLPGIPTKDPVFGLDATWIEEPMQELAIRSGYTVIPASAMVSTHLAEVVKKYAAELLSRQDVLQLLDNAKKTNEAAVNELIPAVLGVADVQKVLQHLLRERVAIRDMVTILETMADFAGRIKDPDQLGELVRASVSRTITRQYSNFEGKLFCITLEPATERQLIEGISTTAGGAVLIMESQLQTGILQEIQTSLDNATAIGNQPVLLCSTQLRLPLRRFLDRHLPALPVMAYNEVTSTAEVEFVGQVRAAA